jgi:hypothetical protein
MTSYGSIQVVRIWCGKLTNPILKHFVNPEGLSYGDLLVGMVPELTS